MMRTPADVVILGRGGSKGVPGKNVRVIAGQPCVVWSVRAAMEARASGHVGEICVSSDDVALLTIVLGFGVRVIQRPASLATDLARVDDALRHAIEVLDGTKAGAGKTGAGKTGGDDYDDDAPVVMLYANVPVRPRGCIARAIELLWETGADSVQTYQPVGKMHPWWMVKVDETSGQVAAWDDGELFHGVYRRQDLPRALVPDGAVAVMTRRALFGRVAGGEAGGPHAFFGKDRRGVVNAEGSVVDIDAEIDVLVAEAMLSR